MAHFVTPTTRYFLPTAIKIDLERRTPRFGFDGLGEVVYLRTYSRLKKSGKQEQWHDTVIRVVEGAMTIYADYMRKHAIKYNDDQIDKLACDMADYIYEMRFLPPGRGLWALGSDYVYERGSAALNNCGYIEITQLSKDSAWLMDMLMCGVGIGFSTHTLSKTDFYMPDVFRVETFEIPDSREGWVESVRRLIASYERPNQPSILFDYSSIRAAGEPIKGFGGTASGYAPLEKLHNRIHSYFYDYCHQQPGYTSTRLVADIQNAIGACVVAGNVRRSAELATGLATDESFLNLKDYALHPERAELGWMSNNSVLLQKPEDFLNMPLIADRLIRRDAEGKPVRDENGKIIVTGDPGIVNMMNVEKYGRFKEKTYGPDNAVGTNPCAEQFLASRELCNLVEVFPTRCDNEAQIYEAMHLATTFASIVSLLPTHDEQTNEVIQKNHRIGVSVSGIADWLEKTSIADLTRILRTGYEQIVRPTNEIFMEHLGLQPSIRVTTVKPSGTISQLAGVSPGMHWPTFRYAIRRMRISETSPLVPILQAAGYPSEEDVYSDNTLVFEFPIDQGKTRSAKEVSMWEQASMLAFLQREWSDNGVSCTIYFDPEKEGHDLERLLSMYAPQIKAMSLLGHTDAGAYRQMPYEGINRNLYLALKKQLSPINVQAFIDGGMSDGLDTRFCETDKCEVTFGPVAD